MKDRYKESIQGARDCVERNKDGGVYLPDLLRVIDSQQVEIERLQGLLSEWKTEAYKLSDSIDNIKSEAIKEVLDKLKDTKIKFGDEYMIYADNIDVIEKEMVGEQG
jgi:predicted transcriptional regulator